MAWQVENRRTAVTEKPEGPYLTDDMNTHLREKYFPRYPTKKAVLLPALHLVQHAYNWIPQEAMVEIAELLEIAPAEVIDTATFYEEYWLKPKGKYLIQVCRSLACEICGSKKITDHVKRTLNVEPFETSPDGKFTLVELECLGSCGTAPAMLMNEVLFEDITTEMVDQLIARLPDDPHDFKDPSIPFEDKH
jgi:NADH-quinone oxidoreductase subunit E